MQRCTELESITCGVRLSTWCLLCTFHLSAILKFRMQFLQGGWSTAKVIDLLASHTLIPTTLSNTEVLYSPKHTEYPFTLSLSLLIMFSA